MADSKEKDEKLEETIKAIQEAKKKYDELCQDEHACYIAELREKYVWETASVRQLGKEEGEKKRKRNWKENWNNRRGRNRKEKNSKTYER